jgi:hypothetical protein
MNPIMNELAHCTKYPGYYVNRNGEIFRKLRANPATIAGRDAQLITGDGPKLAPSLSNQGYPVVKLYYQTGAGTPESPTVRKHKTVNLHRVIWEAFNGDVPEGKNIDHIDRNQANCRLDNLRVVSRRVNQYNKAPKAYQAGPKLYCRTREFCVESNSIKKIVRTRTFATEEEARAGLEEFSVDMALERARFVRDLISHGY